MHNVLSQTPMSTRHHWNALARKSTNISCASHTRSVPWHTHTHSHPGRVPKPWHPGPCYNYKADEHMATKRSREGSRTEWSDRGNDLQNKEADLGEQVQESATRPHDTTGMTLENFLEHTRLSRRLSCVNVHVCTSAVVHLLVRLYCMCAWLCVSVSRSKADVSSGEENPRNWLLYHWGYLPILGINIFNSPS